MSVVARTIVGAGSVLAGMGSRIMSRLGVLYSGADMVAPDGAQLSIEHYKLGRAHALVGQKPLHSSPAYLDGYAAGQRLAERPAVRV